MVQYSSDSFLWQKADNTFTAEVSELTHGHSSVLFDPLPGNKYGLDMRSERTGTIKTFVLIRTERDADGDITAWRLAEKEHQFKRNPLYITVFND